MLTGFLSGLIIRGWGDGVPPFFNRSAPELMTPDVTLEFQEVRQAALICFPACVLHFTGR